MTDIKSNAVGGDNAVITIGRDSTGKLAQTTLGEMKSTLIGGLSGSGKTALLQHIVKDLAEQDVQVYLLDFKRVGFLDFKEKNNVRLITTFDEVPKLLQAACVQLEARYAEMELTNTDVCEAKRIVILIDEAAEMMTQCSANEKEQLRRLLSLGRQCGMYVIMATQSPSRRILSGAIVDMFPSRIALKVATVNASRVILDRKGAENLPLYSALWQNPQGFLSRIQLLPPLKSNTSNAYQVADSLDF